MRRRKKRRVSFEKLERPNGEMQLKLLAVASNLSLTLSPLFDNSEILYPSVFSTSSPFVIFDLKWYIYFVVRKFV